MSFAPSRARCSPVSPTYGALLRDGSPPAGFSTLITVAPSAPRSCVAYGPASAIVKSTTVIPSSGRGSSAIGGDVSSGDRRSRRRRNLPVMVEHSERVRVGWIDTDAGGRIHFTVAFRWAEIAETGLYRKLGLLDEGRGDYPRRHVEADFLRVLVFDDEVELRIRVEAVGRTSIRFAWEGIHDGEIAITGGHTIVRVDADGRPTPIDDRTREALSG